MRWAPRHGAVLLAACAALCGVLAAPAGIVGHSHAAASGLEISGQVCARAGDAPVAGAEVAGGGAAVIADGAGRFRISMPAAQHVLVRASALGYQSTDLITLSSQDGSPLSGAASFSFCGGLGLTDAFHSADGTVRLGRVDQLQPARAHAISLQGVATAPLEANAALQTPGGGVLLLPIQQQGTAISVSVPLRAGRGRYVLEINAAAGFALIKLPLFAGGVYQSPPAPPIYQADPPGASTTTLRASALAGLNALRRQAGLPPLQPRAQLDRGAQAHSEDMGRSGRISHAGTDGSTPGQRVEATGVPFHLVAEDIGGGPTVQEILLGLMDSPAHRWAILGAFRLVGIGIAGMGDQGLVLTADFVG